MSYSGMNNVEDAHNFIAVYPQGTVDRQGNSFFNVGYAFHADSVFDNVGFIEVLVVQIQTALCTGSKEYFPDRHVKWC